MKKALLVYHFFFVFFLFSFAIPLPAQETEKIYTPEQYLNEVKKNELRSAGKEFTVRGRLHSFNRYGDISFVNLELRGELMPLMCEFNGDLSNIMSNIVAGELITIKGICDDVITMKDCVILSTIKSTPPKAQNKIYSPDEFVKLVRNISSFDGQIFTIRGRITRVGRGGWLYVLPDGYSVEFEGKLDDFWATSIDFFFTSKQRDEIIDLTVGDVVTITGTYESDKGFLDCTINK